MAVKTTAEIDAQIADLKSQGKTLSTSKKLAKLVDHRNRGATIGAPDPVTEGNIGSTGDLNSFLSGYSDSIFDVASSNPEARKEELEGFLQPDFDRPELLDRTQAYVDLREEYGVEELEGNLTNLNAEIEEELALLTAQRADERSKPVAQNVIAGRIGEQERTAQERVDFLNRQKSTIVSQLQTSYAVIGQMMEFMSLDYNDAVSAYKDEFNKNLSIYGLIVDERQEAKSDFFNMQKIASANLQTIQNNITSGNLNYNDLPEDQKVLIQKLEIQSGLPAGFTSNLKLSEKDKVLFTSSSGGVTTVGIMGADGQITTQKYGTPTGSGGSGSSSALRTALATGRKDLERGLSWGSVWNRIKSQFPDASSDQIDSGLGTDFREGGAFEKFQQRTSGGGSTDGLRDAISAYNRTENQDTKDRIREAFVQDFPLSSKQFDDAVNSF